MINTILEAWAQCFYELYYNYEMLDNRSLTEIEKSRRKDIIKENNIKITLLREILENGASYTTLRKLPKIREESRRRAIANFNKKYNP